MPLCLLETPKNVLSLVLNIFSKLQVFESNTTSDRMVKPIRSCVTFKSLKLKKNLESVLENGWGIRTLLACLPIWLAL